MAEGGKTWSNRHKESKPRRDTVEPLRDPETSELTRDSRNRTEITARYHKTPQSDGHNLHESLIREGRYRTWARWDPNRTVENTRWPIPAKKDNSRPEGACAVTVAINSTATVFPPMFSLSERRQGNLGSMCWTHKMKAWRHLETRME